MIIMAYCPQFEFSPANIEPRIVMPWEYTQFENDKKKCKY